MNFFAKCKQRNTQQKRTGCCRGCAKLFFESLTNVAERKKYFQGHSELKAVSVSLVKCNIWKKTIFKMKNVVLCCVFKCIYNEILVNVERNNQ